MPEVLGSIRVWKVRPDARLPVRASPGAIGYDVFASRVLDPNTREVREELPVTILPDDAILIGVGFAMALPWGHQVEVRPRSGLATKHRIELGNSPGTIDPDFRGEAGCLLVNRGRQPFTIEPEMRVAQLIFSQVEIPDLLEVATAEELPPTMRGIGGFGSTGLTGVGLGTEEYQREIARRDRYFMGIVVATSRLSNCVRGCQRAADGSFPRDEQGYLVGQTRRYGCVIAIPEELRVIATGFNGQYPGSELCADVGCERDERGIPSGQMLEVCRAIHAEEMAFLTAANVGIPVAGTTIYVNSIPCLSCAKLIAGSSIHTVVVKKGGYGETHGLGIVKASGKAVREIEFEE